MPATVKKGGGQWGITWAEVADLVEASEASLSCKLVTTVQWLPVSKGSSKRHWCVSTRALRGRAGASRLEGYAECTVGTARGAASFPGAFVRSTIDALLDLERRIAEPAYDRDFPVVPLP